MPDINIFVYAHRPDDRMRDAYRVWLEATLSSTTPFAVSALVAAGFVRIVTNRRIYSDPTPLPVALAFIDAILARPTCQLVCPGPRHWEILAALSRSSAVTGGDISDAAHAAVAMENGCELISRDMGFARFEAAGLKWRHLVLG